MEPDRAHIVLQAVAGTDLEMPSILGLGTGMRLGECLGIRWKDVDLDTGRAHVAQILQVNGAFDIPESHRSCRSISLPGFVVEALRRHKAAQNERRLLIGSAWEELDLVCDRGDGRALDPRNVSRKFRALTRSLGIDLTFHGLRHGFATLMLASGVPLKVTQGLLGHSSFAITADIYTHVAEHADQEAAKSLEGLLFPNQGSR